MRDPLLTGRMTLPEGMEVRGFDFTTQATADEITIGIGYNRQPTNRLRNVYCSRAPAIIPDPTRQMKIQGHANDSAYSVVGYTIAKQLTEILAKHGAPSGPVLDWGCGCARVIQHMPHEILHGCDIDRDNIDWCRSNIKNATFAEIKTNSPADYSEGFFAAVYGISVFTHLNEAHETFWLNELARITKADGLVLVSTHGAVAALRAGFGVAMTGNTNTLIDRGINPDLDSFIEDKEYYRNVFHTPQYIYRNWGRHFEIEEIYEGIIGNNQDLVVLRKR